MGKVKKNMAKDFFAQKFTFLVNTLCHIWNITNTQIP